MKKQILIATLVSLCTLAAQASTVVCNTNTTNDPRKGNTSISISTIDGQLTATEITRGGMAHFVSAPKYIPVQAKNVGPEVVFYFNADVGFQLQVGFQPIGGKRFGTLTQVIDGKDVETPVVCNIGQN
jgi:hypothetical protein